MNIKLTIAGIIISMGMLMVTSEAAWSHNAYCSGEGWHMVGKKCAIPPAATWQEYNSGVYLQPSTTTQGFLFLR